MKTFHELLEKYRHTESKRNVEKLGNINGMQFQFLCGFDKVNFQDLESRLKEAGITMHELTAQFPFIEDCISNQKYEFIAFYLNFQKTGFKIFLRYFSESKTAEIIALIPPEHQNHESHANELMLYFESIGLPFEDNSVDMMRKKDSVELVMFEKEDGKYDVYGEIYIDVFTHK